MASNMNHLLHTYLNSINLSFFQDATLIFPSVRRKAKMNNLMVNDGQASPQVHKLAFNEISPHAAVVHCNSKFFHARYFIPFFISTFHFIFESTYVFVPCMLSIFLCANALCINIQNFQHADIDFSGCIFEFQASGKVSALRSVISFPGKRETSMLTALQ